MRNKLSFILFALCYFAASAQNGQGEFFAYGKYWVCEEYNYWNSQYRSIKISVGEYTLFNGIRAKALYYEMLEDGSNRSCYAIGYEDDGRIYIGWDEDCPAWLMLDFNAAGGDFIGRYGEGEPMDIEDYGFEIKEVDVINIAGHSRKMLTLYSTDMKKLYYWVDGVGTEDIDAFITEIPVRFGVSLEEEGPYIDGGWIYHRMVECYQDDELIYSHDILEQYLAGKGGNLAGVGQVVASAPDDNQPLYDLMGRRVTTPQPGRIYVSPTGKRLFR